ncbi:hypothetical protein ACNRBH_23820 [Ralstonia pseudosolanacearum]|uniref:hypothetical protein n=1 Tax=Ralstonia pseudosolanacearum TaxID=1310165 RepID=UPI003AAB8388
MKRLLMKLFLRAEPVPTPEPVPAPATTPAPRKPGGKRKYGNGKRRRPTPPGARKIDPNGPIIQQARGSNQ